MKFLNRRKWAVLLILTLITGCTHLVAGEKERDVDRLFLAWNRLDSPGAAIGVVRNGEVVYQSGYGSAQPEYRVPLKPSTIFHVASLSKQFTAAAVLLLAQQGKLNLDDPVRKYLPELSSLDPRITLHHLIHHTSGLRDQWELLAMAGWRLDDVITRQQILKLLGRQQDLNFEPGEEFLYCNTGYTLLAEVVSSVSGQKLDDFAREEIFGPLKMERTHFHDDHERLVEDRAYSFKPDGQGGYRKAVLSYANAGATSLFTTAEDLSRWMVSLLEGKLGGPELQKLMRQRGALNNGRVLDYAAGLLHGRYRGLETLSHGGADAAFRSHLLLIPKHSFGVVVLSNRSDSNPGRLARRIADLYLADEFTEQPDSAANDVEVSYSLLSAYGGRYQLENGIEVLVTVERGRQLTAQSEGEPRVRLHPLATDRFEIREIQGELTFQGPVEGKSPAFELKQGGLLLKAERQPDPAYSEQELNELTGHFYSPELQLLYHIELSGGQLIVEHQRHPDVPLHPLSPDLFRGSQWWLQRLRFLRDAEGKVTGMAISGSRVRNLRFKKVEL